MRLATPPPPVVMLNGQETPDETANTTTADGGYSDRWDDIARATTASLYAGADDLPFNQALPGTADDTQYLFEKTEDRTNVDSLMSYFVQHLGESEWFDASGDADERACIGEVTAVVNATLENMLKTSTSSQGFLINLAALAGAKMLLHGRGKCFRLRDDKEFYHYRFEWEYRLGQFKGQFNMKQSVPRSMWERPVKDPKLGAEDVDCDGGGLTTEDWQRKYAMLLREMNKRETEISNLKAKMWTSTEGDKS